MGREGPAFAHDDMSFANAIICPSARYARSGHFDSRRDARIERAHRRSASRNGPSGLFGEPQLVWDSLDANTFREGVSVRVSSGRPTVKKPPGYPNPILQSDRLEEATRANLNCTVNDLAAKFGKRPNWVWGLIRIGRLPTRIKDIVRGFGPTVLRSQVTSIDLLRIARLPSELQQTRFAELLMKRGMPQSEEAPTFARLGLKSNRLKGLYGHARGPG
jgi:hypothetical protein